jgi:K+-sensing histidine kinase KdpD
VTAQDGHVARGQPRTGTPLCATSVSAGALASSELTLDEGDRAELPATILAESDRPDRPVGNLLDLSRLQVWFGGAESELWEIDELIVQCSRDSARTADASIGRPRHEANGGRVWAESRTDQGSAFVLALPLQLAGASREQECA